MMLILCCYNYFFHFQKILKTEFFLTTSLISLSLKKISLSSEQIISICKLFSHRFLFCFCDIAFFPLIYLSAFGSYVHSILFHLPSYLLPDSNKFFLSIRLNKFKIPVCRCNSGSAMTLNL